MGILFGMGKWLISAVLAVCVGGMLLRLGLSPERWVADVISGTHPWAHVYFWVIAGALGTIAIRLVIWALWDRRPRGKAGAFDKGKFSGAQRPPPFAKDNVVPALVMLGALVLLGAGLSYMFKFSQKENLEPIGRNIVEVLRE